MTSAPGVKPAANTGIERPFARLLLVASVRQVRGSVGGDG